MGLHLIFGSQVSEDLVSLGGRAKDVACYANTVAWVGERSVHQNPKVGKGKVGRCMCEHMGNQGDGMPGKGAETLHQFRKSCPKKLAISCSQRCNTNNMSLVLQTRLRSE